MNVKLTQSQKIKVAGSGDIYKIMQQVLLRENKLSRAQEHFWIVGLNYQSQILFIELLALGQHNRVSTKPPEAFRIAIYKLATQVVFVHNHPGGSIAVSQADSGLTDYLYKTGKLLGIDVVDHLIITEKSYTSFLDKGLMSEISASGKWEVQGRTEVNANKKAFAITTEISEKKKVVEIAKKLKESGMADGDIKKITGLRLADVRKL